MVSSNVSSKATKEEIWGALIYCGCSNQHQVDGTSTEIVLKSLSQQRLKYLDYKHLDNHLEVIYRKPAAVQYSSAFLQSKYDSPISAEEKYC